MEIILLENIAKLGKIGDLVKVKNGYARNFLLKKRRLAGAKNTNFGARGESEFEVKKYKIL